MSNRFQACDVGHFRQVNVGVRVVAYLVIFFRGSPLRCIATHQSAAIATHQSAATESLAASQSSTACAGKWLEQSQKQPALRQPGPAYSRSTLLRIVTIHVMRARRFPQLKAW